MKRERLVEILQFWNDSEHLNETADLILDEMEKDALSVSTPTGEAEAKDPIRLMQIAQAAMAQACVATDEIGLRAYRQTVEALIHSALRAAGGSIDPAAHPQQEGEQEYRCKKCGAQADERWDCCQARKQIVDFATSRAEGMGPAPLSVSTPTEERAAALSRANSPIPGDMAQHAYPEPSVSTPTGEGEATKQAWRPMKDAPTGFPIVAKHKPNSAMPYGWIATILLGHGDEDEPGSLDTILHYNGTSIYGVFHGCWDGWMHCEDAAALAHLQQGGERDGAVNLPSEEELGEIIHEAVCSHNDMDVVHWYYVARDVARALREPVPTAPTAPSKSSGEEA